MTDPGPVDQENGRTYRLWVDKYSTVLVRMWENGTVEVATRQTPAHIWSPPIRMTEEQLHD
jgi:hypothetical protein